MGRARTAPERGSRPATPSSLRVTSARWLLFLIDRSGSMGEREPAGDGSTPAARAARAVEGALAALVAAGSASRPNLRVRVVGYGGRVASATRGRLARRWATRNPRARPPCIIHLTDGLATDGDPAGAVEALAAVRTCRGAVVLANVLLAPAEPAASFPARCGPRERALARKLHRLSSALPGHLRRALRRRGLDVEPSARAFVMGPDVEAAVVALALAVAGAGSRGRGAGTPRRRRLRRRDQTGA